MVEQRCPKHPSMRTGCACNTHVRQAGEQRQVRNMSRTSTSVWAEATFSSAIGIITVCGACGGVAADHEAPVKSEARERTVQLLTFVRTNQCKHCGADLADVKGLPCDANPDGTTHTRRYLPRSKKVSACLECAVLGTVRVESAEFAASPRCYIDIWQAAIDAKWGERSRVVMHLPDDERVFPKAQRETPPKVAHRVVKIATTCKVSEEWAETLAESKRRRLEREQLGGYSSRGILK